MEEWTPPQASYSHRSRSHRRGISHAIPLTEPRKLAKSVLFSTRNTHLWTIPNLLQSGATFIPCNVHRIYTRYRLWFSNQHRQWTVRARILEINQAGLSWTTILNKQNNFKQAYDQFDIETIAEYTQTDINRLLNDACIIRNKLKINAAIENAKTILVLQSQFGSFKNWLDNHHPKTKDEWVKIFKKTLSLQVARLLTSFWWALAICHAHTTKMARSPTNCGTKSKLEPSINY